MRPVSPLVSSQCQGLLFFAFLTLTLDKRLWNAATAFFKIGDFTSILSLFYNKNGIAEYVVKIY